MAGTGYAFSVDMGHMSREYRYVVYVDDGSYVAGAPAIPWRWAELRLLVDALSFGRHVAEYDEGVEFSSTVHNEVQVFGKLLTEIVVEQLVMPPDLVALRRAVSSATSDAGSWSISLEQYFSPRDPAPLYGACIQAGSLLSEDELVRVERPREVPAPLPRS